MKLYEAFAIVFLSWGSLMLSIYFILGLVQDIFYLGIVYDIYDWFLNLGVTAMFLMFGILGISAFVHSARAQVEKENRYNRLREQIEEMVESKKKICSFCMGYGFWCWGDLVPVGPMDAEDFVPTMACPECGANPNPIDIVNKERETMLEKMYKNRKG